MQIMLLLVESKKGCRLFTLKWTMVDNGNNVFFDGVSMLSDPTAMHRSYFMTS